MSHDAKELPETRCGYCDHRFPIDESGEHWTNSTCNLRPTEAARRIA